LPYLNDPPASASRPRVSDSPQAGQAYHDLPLPSDDALEHGARVLQHIRERIVSEGGWIPFTAFMELALHAPGLGYYAAGSQKFGASGDFVTAPEITPLFGRCLARQVAQILEHTGGDVIELGAGSGALAGDILCELDRLGRLPERYRILEPSPDLAQRQRHKLEQSIPYLTHLVDWTDSLPRRLAGVVIANEVLDVLPVHLVVWRNDGLFERGVAIRDGALAWEERPADESLHEGVSEMAVSPPYLSEVSPTVTAFTTSLAGCIEHGAALLIDYGFGRSEYYHPQRSGGTLMCHYRHRTHDDPFFLPGLQDITAHVDFTAVATAGVNAGCALAGYTTQAQFLLNCGITELLAQTPAEDTADYLPRAAAVQKLVSPAEMGELFKVIALSRGIEAPLLGFSEGDRTGRL
jgi:SAM-dependent MidA family methyltransferase